MNEISIDFKIDQLIKWVEDIKKDISSLKETDLTFEIENIAQDIGKQVSTGLYYYAFVDDGRNRIVASPGKKLRYRDSDTGKWRTIKKVRRAKKVKITEAILPKLKKENDKVSKDLLKDGKVPSIGDIKAAIELLKTNSLKICELEALRKLPEEYQHKTRSTLYGADEDPGIAEGFRIKGEEDRSR